MGEVSWADFDVPDVGIRIVSSSSSPRPSSSRSPAATPTKTPSGYKTKPCRHFFREGRCSHGDDCNYSHDRAAHSPTGSPMPTSDSGWSGRLGSGRSPPSFSVSGPSLSPRYNQDDSTVSEDDPIRAARIIERESLAIWSDKLPYARKQREFRHVHPSTLAAIFNDALELVSMSPGAMQEVVTKLSEAGGIHSIKLLLEVNWTSLNPLQRHVAFNNGGVLALFRILTHEKVISSSMVEHNLTQIYNFVFGPSGSRALATFRYLPGMVEFYEANHTTPDQDLGQEPGMAVEKDRLKAPIEACLHLFSRILDTNGTAPVTPGFAPILEAFERQVERLSDYSTLQSAMKYLVRAKGRLGLGQDLPEAIRELSRKLADVSFDLAQYWPGERSPNGPRHDNDHADIVNIEILPTSGEIASEKTEYLPVLDPSQHHLSGSLDLLDRQFRLLREDTIGQLRDSIRIELRRLQGIDEEDDPTLPRGTLRTWTYTNVLISYIDCLPFKGFHVTVDFDQPDAVSKMGERRRNDWWRTSRRLFKDALVCLIGEDGSTVFCTVANGRLRTSKRPAPGNKAESDDGEDTEELRGLASSSSRATIQLRIVGSEETSLESVLQRYGSKRHLAVSLVEFPGVVLPAFQSTLEALQVMSNSGEIPFARLLVPAHPEGPVPGALPLPHYAAEPGFTYDLTCLSRNGRMLGLDPSQTAGTVIESLVASTLLDEAQSKSLVHALTSNVAMLQGPPGTGKSFLGVALIRTLISNRQKGRLGPIILLSFTNHALDQMIHNLLDSNVIQIIRLGGMSKSEDLAPLNLFYISHGMENTKSENELRWRCLKAMKEELGEIQRLIKLVPAIESYDTLNEFLRRHNSQHAEQLFGNGPELYLDEEGFRTKAPRRSRAADKLQKWLRGGTQLPDNVGCRPVDAMESLRLQDLTMKERQELYSFWMSEIRGSLHDSIQRHRERFTAAVNRINSIQVEVELRCLEKANVIALTTTGLARHLNLLKRVGSKCAVIEEAGEVLEAHALTSLLGSLEHLVMIGDHLQLRPHIQNYTLQLDSPNGKDFALDVSLFERLVSQSGTFFTNKLPFSTLSIQRRMHPSIAELVRTTLYPRLTDAEGPKEYPTVSGFKDRLAWMDHNHKEDSASAEGPAQETTSRSNEWEVDMVEAMVKHLVMQGVYKAGDLAVLTPYLGQLLKLKRRLKDSFAIVLNERDLEDLDDDSMEEDDFGDGLAKTSLLDQLRIATVDNFQGEEAKIVIVSLVRCNERKDCGFLRSKNRTCVLLSRAQHGMYIVGSAETYRNSGIWGEVIHLLESQKLKVEGLRLRCDRHPETEIVVSEPDDFVELAPEGGCSLPCARSLDCGHKCELLCHSDPMHQATRCMERCQKVLPGCDHLCTRECGVACEPRCQQEFQGVLLPCGHRCTIPCWQYQDLDLAKCREIVEKTSPGCDHRINVPCHVNVHSEDYQCLADCDTVLDCSHVCQRKCNTCRPRLEGVVDKPNHGYCRQLCVKQFDDCSHTCTASCHWGSDCPACDGPCEVFCGHQRCDRVCSDPCAPCLRASCDSHCPHSECSMPCSAPCDWTPCSRRCENKLECGHHCPSLCGEICPQPQFCQLCGLDYILASTVDGDPGRPFKDVDLDKQVCLFLGCGHVFTVDAMDKALEFSTFYATEGAGVLTPYPDKRALPFDINTLNVKVGCPTCAGPIRNIARYGRIVRRVMSDTRLRTLVKGFSERYLGLSDGLSGLQHDAALWSDQMLNTNTGGKMQAELVGLDIFVTQNNKKWKKKTLDQFPAVKRRYREVSGFLRHVADFEKAAEEQEEPYEMLRDLVEDVKIRQDDCDAQASMDCGVVQTSLQLKAKALSVQVATVVIGDFLRLVQCRSVQCTLKVNFNPLIEECKAGIEKAVESHLPRVQIEFHISLANLLNFQAEFPPSVNYSIDMEAPMDLLNRAREHLDSATDICADFPAVTVGLTEDIEQARQMMRTFQDFRATTGDLKLDWMEARLDEVRGPGAWCFCENKHPFVLGDPDEDMEQCCPDCGRGVWQAM